jgi:hypothetical protein
MGMFDEYIPDPPLPCPACGKTLADWQGEDGPNLLLVWKQGERFPIDCRLADEMYHQGKASFLRSGRHVLPERFEFHTDVCDCNHLVYGVGRCVDGVWTEAELMSPRNARPYPHENDRDFRDRLRHLARWHGGGAATGGQE